MKKQLLFPVVVLGMALPLCLSNQHNGVNAEFIGDYSQQKTYTEAGSKLNKEICDEGFVLLKNKDNFLPMSSQGKKVSLVGKSSGNLVRGGGGSGSGSVNGEENWQLFGDASLDIKGALEEYGFDVNKSIQDPDLVEQMVTIAGKVTLKLPSVKPQFHPIVRNYSLH